MPGFGTRARCSPTTPSGAGAATRAASSATATRTPGRRPRRDGCISLLPVELGTGRPRSGSARREPTPASSSTTLPSSAGGATSTGRSASTTPTTAATGPARWVTASPRSRSAPAARRRQSPPATTAAAPGSTTTPSSAGVRTTRANSASGTRSTGAYGPHDMGNALPAVDLGVLPASMRGRPSPSPVRPASSPADTIDFDVDVQNTGERRLTQVQVHAPEVPGCARTPGRSLPGRPSRRRASTRRRTPTPPRRSPTSPCRPPRAPSTSRTTQRVPVAAKRYRPDALIRRSGAFAGNNVYNTTGASQTRTATVPNLGTATFTAPVENDGNTVDGVHRQGSRHDQPLHGHLQGRPDERDQPRWSPAPTPSRTSPPAPATTSPSSSRPRPAPHVGNTLNRVVTVSSTTTPTHQGRRQGHGHPDLTVW